MARQVAQGTTHEDALGSRVAGATARVFGADGAGARARERRDRLPRGHHDGVPRRARGPHPGRLALLRQARPREEGPGDHRALGGHQLRHVGQVQGGRALHADVRVRGPVR